MKRAEQRTGSGIQAYRILGRDMLRYQFDVVLEPRNVGNNGELRRIQEEPSRREGAAAEHTFAAAE